MTFADIDNQLLLQGPALARLTDEGFFDLCQHNSSLRLERTADYNVTATLPCLLRVQRRQMGRGLSVR